MSNTHKIVHYDLYPVHFDIGRHYTIHPDMHEYGMDALKGVEDGHQVLALVELPKNVIVAALSYVKRVFEIGYDTAFPNSVEVKFFGTAIRGAGLGTKLLRYLRYTLATSGEPLLRLFSVPDATEFYRKFGFKISNLYKAPMGLIGMTISLTDKRKSKFLEVIRVMRIRRMSLQ